ncbi:uncharacterized protein LOC114533553 [Dendronephthya gigantea]|uniref:uncharacterized protein LOC114533553 n=1 Tax=Dendronephthya gigantea TaxID=151771 RepID=UPI00106B4438|nr:uncharacterized protein LOC114533553 [Dendronephthya gigantea]
MSCVGHCSLAVEFSGFEDEESGIGGCVFSIITEDQTTIIMPVQPTTNQNKIEVNYLTLQHGERYKVIVACDNTVGQRSLDVSSPPIRIDNTPPGKGFVIISPDRNHDVRRGHVGCHFINTTLRIYWSRFYDEESNIAGFRVSIRRKPRGSDVIPYTYFGITSEARFHLHENYGLSLGQTIFATVEATNKAGLSIEATSPLTRLISLTDSNLVNEQDFLCVNF